MTDKKTIFVTGATGRHGGTGKFVVSGLLEKNQAVRALARTDDDRAQELRDMGAEVVIGDLHDRRTLLPALKDVDLAYFTYPVGLGIVDAAANFASAARENAVKNIVVMSMAPSNPQSPSPLGRAQWLAEELFELEGFNCIVLRVAALFFENIELLHNADIAGDGVMRNSFADIKLNWMAGADAARLAVSALLQPENLADSKIIYPSGSQQFTHTEVAEKVGRHLKKLVKHETISAEDWESRLLELGRFDKRIDAGMAKHISAVGAKLTQA